MTARRRLALVVAALVVALVVVWAALAAAFATLPVAIALASVVLALVVGLRSHTKIAWWRWRPRAAGRSEGPWAAAGAPPTLDGLSWTTAWDTMPPPSAMPVVRERVAAVLTGWGLPGEAAEPSLLALTELVTNAIEHATAPLRLTLGLGPEFVRVEVHDAARSHPPVDGRGHGLEIVAGLALRHGWTPEPYGKLVWADVGIGWPE
jgi:Histidine kinase-like ATPase domain